MHDVTTLTGTEWSSRARPPLLLFGQPVRCKFNHHAWSKCHEYAWQSWQWCGMIPLRQEIKRLDTGRSQPRTHGCLLITVVPAHG